MTEKEKEIKYEVEHDQPAYDKPQSEPHVGSSEFVVPLATPEPVPFEIASCPECGGALTWQVMTKDGLNDLLLECENEKEIDETVEDDGHRFWQSDWQPIYNAVKTWLRKRHNKKLSYRHGQITDGSERKND